MRKTALIDEPAVGTPTDPSPLIAQLAAPIGPPESRMCPSSRYCDLRRAGRARKTFVVRCSQCRQRDVAAERRHHVPRARAGALRAALRLLSLSAVRNVLAASGVGHLTIGWSDAVWIKCLA